MLLRSSEEAIDYRKWLCFPWQIYEYARIPWAYLGHIRRFIGGRMLRALPVQKRSDATSGQALVELALVLPIAALLLLALIEVSNGINAYITVSEASRSGARLAVMEGTLSGVQSYVEGLTERLPRTNTVVYAFQGTDNSGNRMFTVEVRYEYRTILRHTPFIGRVIPNPLVLRATTVMPAP